MATVNVDCDVCVVGAGISGLACARRLVEAGVPGSRIAIVEARDRVGGRTESIHASVPPLDGTTDFVDVGGQWVCDAQPRVMALVKALGLTTITQKWFASPEEASLAGDADGGRPAQQSGVPAAASLRSGLMRDCVQRARRGRL